MSSFQAHSDYSSTSNNITLHISLHFLTVEKLMSHVAQCSVPQTEYIKKSVNFLRSESTECLMV